MSTGCPKRKMVFSKGQEYFARFFQHKGRFTWINRRDLPLSFFIDRAPAIRCDFCQRKLFSPLILKKVFLPVADETRPYSFYCRQQKAAIAFRDRRHFRKTLLRALNKEERRKEKKQKEENKGEKKNIKVLNVMYVLKSILYLTNEIYGENKTNSMLHNVLLELMNRSTCFGHYYAHRQELATVQMVSAYGSSPQLWQVAGLVHGCRLQSRAPDDGHSNARNMLSDS